jgi:hypothetical protein
MISTAQTTRRFGVICEWTSGLQVRTIVDTRSAAPACRHIELGDEGHDQPSNNQPADLLAHSRPSRHTAALGSTEHGNTMLADKTHESRIPGRHYIRRICIKNAIVGSLLHANTPTMLAWRPPLVTQAEALSADSRCFV